MDLCTTIAILTFFDPAFNLLAFCYLGDQATELMLKTSLNLYSSLWFNLPIDLQKYFTMLIANTRTPLIFSGFGVLNASLKTYVAVSEIVEYCW